MEVRPRCYFMVTLLLPETPNRAFFNDDPGNELKLYPERLSATDGDKLDVMGGSKVTLMGQKEHLVMTTRTPTGDIMVYFRAMDDDGQESADRVRVLNVRVDEAPKVVSEIGTRLIRLTGDHWARPRRP